MNRIRWKLLVSMLMVVVVAVGLSALFTRTVIHRQVRHMVVEAGSKIPIENSTQVTATPLEVAILDERLLVSFAGAALAAILLTLLLSRRITSPIERLTAAVQEMARGNTSAHVPVTGRDEIARLALAFNAMADAIAKQEDLRRRMVSDVAHELRTPLTNLRCEIEALQDGLAQPDRTRLASLHEEVLHLGRLADDLQDLAVADAGGLRLQRERVDLVSTIGRVAELFRRDGIDITVTSLQPVSIDADPLRIAQVFRNLMDNAVRHGNRIDIAIDADRVTITDNGPGIPPDQIERIFDRFYRVDQARTRESGGAGLGLAIVRRLVELHGGRVWAENVPDGGARFIVTFTNAS